MSARLLTTRSITRHRALHHALGATVGLSFSSAVLLNQQPKVRFDSRTTPRPVAPAVGRKEGLDPDLMKQLSGGTITGAAMVVVQVASRYGINLVEQLRVKQRLGNSRVLAALQKDPAFKLSFGIFFAMSAFMKF
ncbi:hypothetical protein SLS62_009591 [Diatrype stigma]|uniref:Uncharacterized protein n=1 Tax=Diatrype stigma TaxID=117547 RepID=A0AAN9UDU9_9PEZI